jgi:hypothetical protein
LKGWDLKPFSQRSGVKTADRRKLTTRETRDVSSRVFLVVMKGWQEKK